MTVHYVTYRLRRGGGCIHRVVRITLPALLTALSTACSSQMAGLHQESGVIPYATDLSRDDSSRLTQPQGPSFGHGTYQEAIDEQVDRSTFEQSLAALIGFPFRGVGWVITQIF